MTDRLQVQESKRDRFLSCTNCGLALPLDSVFEGEDCYMCGGTLAVRIMPVEAEGA